MVINRETHGDVIRLIVVARHGDVLQKEDIAFAFFHPAVLVGHLIDPVLWRERNNIAVPQAKTWNGQIDAKRQAGLDVEVEYPRNGNDVRESQYEDVKGQGQKDAPSFQFAFHLVKTPFDTISWFILYPKKSPVLSYVFAKKDKKTACPQWTGRFWLT